MTDHQTQPASAVVADLDKLQAIADRVDARGLFNASCDIREWIESTRAALARSAVPASCPTCGGSRVDPGGLPMCRDCAPAVEPSAEKVEIDRLREIARLIGTIFVYGDFKAETYNERELEKLLREQGTFYESIAEFESHIAAPVSAGKADQAKRFVGYTDKTANQVIDEYLHPRVLTSSAGQAGQVAMPEQEYLALRLKRVARAAGVEVFAKWSDAQVSECAVTILGEIARKLENRVTESAAAPERGDTPTLELTMQFAEAIVHQQECAMTPTCVFCGGDQEADEQHHEPDCAYVTADAYMQSQRIDGDNQGAAEGASK